MIANNDFERHASGKILTRGYHYFMDDKLGTFSWTSKNNCEVEVYGSDSYLVLLTLKNELSNSMVSRLKKIIS